LEPSRAAAHRRQHDRSDLAVADAPARSLRAQPMGKPLPSLDHMRSVLRVGMTSGEFFQACDDLMANYQLRLSVPVPSPTDLVGIHVAEGDTLLCFLIEDRLAYVEYLGDVCLGG